MNSNINIRFHNISCACAIFHKQVVKHLKESYEFIRIQMKPNYFIRIYLIMNRSYVYVFEFHTNSYMIIWFYISPYELIFVIVFIRVIMIHKKSCGCIRVLINLEPYYCYYEIIGCRKDSLKQSYEFIWICFFYKIFMICIHTSL